jgi:hypothetical protein
MQHTPSGTNINSLMQYSQFARTGAMQYLDYGEDENLVRYGTAVPPEIPFENIQVPIAFLTARYDDTAAPEDTEWLADRIPTLVFHQWYEGEHMSFTIGRVRNHLPDILELLREYTE